LHRQLRLAPAQASLLVCSAQPVLPTHQESVSPHVRLPCSHGETGSQGAGSEILQALQYVLLLVDPGAKTALAASSFAASNGQRTSRNIVRASGTQVARCTQALRDSLESNNSTR